MSTMEQTVWSKKVRETFYELRPIMKKFNIHVVFTESLRMVKRITINNSSSIDFKGDVNYLTELSDIVITTSAKRDNLYINIQYEVQKPKRENPTLVGAHDPYGNISSFPRELIEMVSSVDGALMAIQGNAGSFRTTTALTVAFNTIAPFPRGKVLLYNCPMSATYSWIAKTMNTDIDSVKENLEIINNRQCTLAGFKNAVQQIAQLKEQYRETHLYEVGQDNVTGERIRRFIPSVIVIDEIAHLALDNDDIYSLDKESDDIIHDTEEQNNQYGK